VASTTLESRTRSGWAVARRIDEILNASPNGRQLFKPTTPGDELDLAVGPGSA
jgi:hypothetical protein